MSEERGESRTVGGRLFAILGAFQRGGPSMTLTEISAATGLPIATTFRLTNELVRHGALSRTDRGDYEIGLRLWELGSLTPRPRELRSAARNSMDALHESTRETVQLVVVEGHRALCVEKVFGSRTVANVTEVARGLPLHATAVGKVILAFCPDEWSRLEGRRLDRYTPRTITDPAVIDAELTRARTERIAYCHEELTTGTASVAAPVFDADGEFVAALGVLTGSPMSLRRLAPLVHDAASAISKRLGFSPLAAVTNAR